MMDLCCFILASTMLSACTADISATSHAMMRAYQHHGFKKKDFLISAIHSHSPPPKTPHRSL